MNNIYWSRSELKQKAKNLLKKYYWNCVLVGFVALIIGDGCNGGPSAIKDVKDIFSESIESSTAIESDTIEFGYDTDDGSYIETVHYDDVYDEDCGISENDLDEQYVFELFIVGVIFLIFCICVVIAILINLFLVNPLIIGIVKFWVGITKDDCQLSYMGYGFKNNYLNNVKTMFFVNLKIFLWSLLFIIPGIIKWYEYFMVPYILAENSGISTKDAFALSKRIMDGQKGNVFLLYLSFLGWMLLSVLTCGILSIFYVTPYVAITSALVSERLKQGISNQAV